jgi:sec-independent protein translocase protein TatA
MFGLGTAEIIVLVLLALLLFGKHLPHLARSFGTGLMQLKKGLSGLEDEVREAVP